MKNGTDTTATIAAWRRHFESALEGVLPPADDEPRRLHAAMRYSVLSAGKRIRPLLAYSAGHALGFEPEALDPLAVAVELVHAYSLIHDDLPAMDDDDLRRGRATCHVAFDEATAILAGDALQAMAFRVLAEDLAPRPGEQLAVISALASACGSTGMAGGQALDLACDRTVTSISQLEQIHLLKTGALIRFSVTAPAILSRADAEAKHALGKFGDCVGLGFQIRDDILDLGGDTRKAEGRQQHSQQGNPSFPSLIGLESSVRRAEALCEEAVACLERVPGDTTFLAWLANYMVSRDR